MDLLPWAPFRCVEVDVTHDCQNHTALSLEAVIANRIPALAEKHQLLPNRLGLVGGGHATSILIEKIHDAWREGKVISLTSFSVRAPITV